MSVHGRGVRTRDAAVLVADEFGDEARAVVGVGMFAYGFSSLLPIAAVYGLGNLVFNGPSPIVVLALVACALMVVAHLLSLRNGRARLVVVFGRRGDYVVGANRRPLLLSDRASLQVFDREGSIFDGLPRNQVRLGDGEHQWWGDMSARETRRLQKEWSERVARRSQ